MKRSKGKATASGAAAFGSKPAFGSAFGPSSGRASSLSYLTEPPSLSEISDPNIVVSIKNVLKKDATTKVKGLEDLVAFAQSHPPETGGDVQDALLDVWVSEPLLHTCWPSRTDGALDTDIPEDIDRQLAAREGAISHPPA